MMKAANGSHGKSSNMDRLDHLAYNSIKKQILEGVLKPGEQLIEMQLAEELGMSRTPVRNALLRLEHERLVTTAGNRGTFVASLSAVDVAEIYDLREVIEGLAARLLARRIASGEAEYLTDLAEKADHSSATLHDEIQFHSAIIHMCGNSRLASLVDTFCIQALTFDERSRQMVASGEAMVLQKDRHERAHRDVVGKIISGDPEAAEECLKAYIRSAKNVLVKALMGLDM